jgi:starvation-inducible DNA-binding protein
VDKFHLALKTAFASEYAFTLKTQYYHWNVEGENFPQYHELFQNIYEEVYASIDPFAENIRKVGAYTPASFHRFSMLSQIDDETDILPAMAMIAQLYQDSERMVEILKILFDMCEELHQHGLSNFIADRMDAHQTHSWKLRSTLK